MNRVITFAEYLSYQREMEQVESLIHTSEGPGMFIERYKQIKQILLHAEIINWWRPTVK